MQSEVGSAFGEGASVPAGPCEMQSQAGLGATQSGRPQAAVCTSFSLSWPVCALEVKIHYF